MILTVIMTMMNTIFERRDEVGILSSVGLNPSHITLMFTAEALIIGIIGGAFGYLLGQGTYQIANVLSITILVEQKVSAIWSLASLGIAVAAVLIGASVAQKSSTIITPSLLLRWSAKEVARPTGEPLTVEIPSRVKEEDLDSLFEFVKDRYFNYLKTKALNESLGTISQLTEETPEYSTRIMNFDYLLGDMPVVGSLPFQLIAKREKGEETFSIIVRCRGTAQVIDRTVSFIRMSIIEWSTRS
jgi:ABC-type antimicrobial peptide transport system permease subunit